MAADDTLDRILSSLYDRDERDRAIFGDCYAPSVDHYPHGTWHVVARIQKSGTDGQSVEIDECRMPARFFRLRALADVNSVGKQVPAFALSTGSGDGMGRLMVALGRAIAEGMVGLAREEDEGQPVTGQ
jgi:hypothetical protein